MQTKLLFKITEHVTHNGQSHVHCVLVPPSDCAFNCMYNQLVPLPLSHKIVLSQIDVYINFESINKQ